MERPTGRWVKALRWASAVGAMAIGCTASVAVAGPDPVVGYRSLAIAAPLRGGDLAVGLWYPADGAGGVSVTIGGSPVFAGVPARESAPMAQGRHPLLVMAHGGLRSASHLGDWLAASLAERGYVVAVIEPARFDSTNGRAVLRELSARPDDFSATVTGLLAAPDMAPFIRADRIVAVGLLRGGTSALAMAGVDVDARRYAGLCLGAPGNPDCRWFAKAGITFSDRDLSDLAVSGYDPRIAAVVAIAPELTSAVAPGSVAKAQHPLIVIDLEDADGAVPGSAVSDLADIQSPEQRLSLKGATPYSLFPSCTAKAVDRLREDGDDESVCREPDGRSRRDVHSDLVALILRSLVTVDAGPDRITSGTGR